MEEHLEKDKSKKYTKQSIWRNIQIERYTEISTQKKIPKNHIKRIHKVKYREEITLMDIPKKI